MDHYKRQAAVLKAMGHPVRLQIVSLLRIAPECVCHLSAALHKPQPYMSQQLLILRNAGVVVDERDGANIFYRLTDDNFTRQLAAVCAENGVKREARQVVASCNCPKCSVARGQAGAN